MGTVPYRDEPTEYAYPEWPHPDARAQLDALLRSRRAIDASRKRRPTADELEFDRMQRLDDERRARRSSSYSRVREFMAARGIKPRPRNQMPSRSAEARRLEQQRVRAHRRGELTQPEAAEAQKHLERLDRLSGR